MGEYRVDPYIRAAVQLQSFTKDDAISELHSMATDQRLRDGVMILCRMLFMKRNGSEFRHPGLGRAFFEGGTDRGDWPLEPIEIIDGVPFPVTKGNIIAGRKAETGESYLNYCVQNCNWSTDRFKMKTEAQLEGAVEKMIASPKWRTPLKEHEIQRFRDQIRLGRD